MNGRGLSFHMRPLFGAVRHLEPALAELRGTGYG